MVSKEQRTEDSESLKWTQENPEQRQLHVKKYVHKNSARTNLGVLTISPTICNWNGLRILDDWKHLIHQKGKLSKRLTLKIADLKDSNLIIIHHHYLHRSRTMGQLPYWICIDEIPVRSNFIFTCQEKVIKLMELNQ